MIPVYRRKTGNDFFTASDYMKYIRKRGRLDDFPEVSSFLMIYQKSLRDFFVRNYTCREYSINGRTLIVDSSNSCVGIVCDFGIGSPSAAAVLEELIASGAKQVISIGTAGTLSEDVSPGDIVCCTGSFRDEGTSYHYLPDSEAAFPDKTLTEKLNDALGNGKQRVFSGLSWTTDAPYRETFEEISFFREKGALTVEMEASALFSVSAYRGIKIASAFCISDRLTGDKWKPQFHAKKVKDGLIFLGKKAMEVFSS